MRHFPVLLLALSAVACSKSNNNGGTGPGPTGSLDITITAPAGVTAKVHVITPADSVITLTTSQTLNGLTPGDYLITASAGVTADPIVSTAYVPAVTGSPATVSGGQTATATVTYSSPRAGAGVLWVANELGSNIAGFTTAQLAASGSPAPTIMLGNGLGNSKVTNPTSLAVDSSGGVWWASDIDTLYYYSAAQAASSTNATPARHLVSTAVPTAIAIAFDPAGNLWVADQFQATLNEFTSAQLASGGNQMPHVILSGILGSIKRPYGITFDAKGDLWVANYGDSVVAGFSPTQLAQTGSPVPFAALSGKAGLGGPLGLAFDAAGNLWVVSVIDTLAKFTPDELTSINNSPPAVLIKLPTLTTPVALAFDNSGSLWVGGYETNKLYKFTSGQLTTSGAPTPAVVVTATASSLALPDALAFSPPASNLPIH